MGQKCQLGPNYVLYRLKSSTKIPKEDNFETKNNFS